MGQASSSTYVAHGAVAGHQQEHGSQVKSAVGASGAVITFGAKLSPGYRASADAGYTFPSTSPPTLPASVDLRQPGSPVAPMPPIWNQGSIGSCTAQSTCAAFAAALQRERATGAQLVDPSRLFQYHYTLWETNSGSTNQDTGSTNPIAMKVLTQGVAQESLWPYDPTEFSSTPPVAAQKDSLLRKGVAPVTLNATVDNLKRSLYNGYPFVVAFQVMNGPQADYMLGAMSASRASTGNVSTLANIMPSPSGSSPYGGHSVLVVGYDDTYTGNGIMTTPVPVFIVRNSWTDKWGDNGYFYMQQNDVIDMQYFGDHMILLGVDESSTAGSLTGATSEQFSTTPPPVYAPFGATTTTTTTPPSAPNAPPPARPIAPQPAPVPGNVMPTAGVAYGSGARQTFLTPTSDRMGFGAPYNASGGVVSPIAVTPPPAPPATPATPAAPGGAPLQRVVTTCPPYLSQGVC